MKNRLFILSGSKGCGKTTALKELLVKLKNNNHKVNGFLALGHWENNKRSYFELENIATNDSILYCTRDEVKSWIEIPPFFINPDAILFGNKILSPQQQKNYNVLVIDEVGPFELQNNGWSKAIKNLIEKSDIPLIWVVRESLINIVPIHFGLKANDIFNIESESIDMLYQRVLTFLENDESVLSGLTS